MDYKKLYLEKYRKLPAYWGLATLLSIGISATITSIIFFILDDGYGGFLLGLGFLTLFLGWIIAAGLGFFVQWISAICLSQSIVVADSLLKMSDNTAPSVEEVLSNIAEELPEI